MATKKHYRIDQKAKCIYADLANLTKKETNEIMKYSMFGYSVVNEESKPRKGVDEAFILAYFGDDEASKQTYAEKKKELNDNGKEKGFVGASVWFMMNNEPKDENGKTLFERVKKDADKIYGDYSATIQKQNEKAIEKAVESGEKAQTKNPIPRDEYIRYYYWKKIFNREA